MISVSYSDKQLIEISLLFMQKNAYSLKLIGSSRILWTTTIIIEVKQWITVQNKKCRICVQLFVISFGKYNYQDGDKYCLMLSFFMTASLSCKHKKNIDCCFCWNTPLFPLFFSISLSPFKSIETKHCSASGVRNFNNEIMEK